MTTAPPLTGQDIALAARFTRLVLDAHLDELGVSFEPMVVVNLVGTGTITTESALRERLGFALGLDDDAVDALLESLVSGGLIDRHDGALAPTPAGEHLRHRSQAAVAEVVDDLYRDLDPTELATTRRVLVEVTERAQARLDR